MRGFGLAILVVWALAGCAPGESSGFDRVGYWKGSNNRIFIIYMDRPQSAAEVTAYAARLPHTEGRATHAFFFSSPVGWGDAVTLARDFDQAYDVIDRHRRAGQTWDFLFAKGFGPTVFADCTANREAPNCTASR